MSALRTHQIFTGWYRHPFFLLCFTILSQNVFPQSVCEAGMLTYFAGFQKAYNIHLTHDPKLAYRRPVQQRNIQYISPDLSNNSDCLMVNNYVNLFANEIKKYPQLFWVKYIKTIVLCKSLTLTVSKGNQQNRSAIPDIKREVLYLDITYLNDKAYSRHIIHHEAFHMFEKHFEGFSNPQWEQLNQQKVQYKNGGRKAYQNQQDAAYSRKCHPQDGLVTGYAHYGVEEDMAEVFGMMMSDVVYPQGCSLARIMQQDCIIADKVDYLLTQYAGLMQRRKQQFINNCGALYQFRMDGQKSTKTGIQLKQGNQVEIMQVAGKITLGPLAGTSGPEGINYSEIWNAIKGKGIKHGALLGGVVNWTSKQEQWFDCGTTGASFKAPFDGELVFFLNDIDTRNNRPEGKGYEFSFRIK